jgi:hypothetical protein
MTLPLVTASLSLGLVRGVELHLVVDRGGEGDADSEEKGEGSRGEE